MNEETFIDKRIIAPFQRFVRIEGLGGILLFGATVIAIIWANSPWGDVYQNIWKYKIGLEGDNFHLVKPLILWVNDALMAIFFFLVGLEIKRELLIGELNSPRKAALPLFGAFGGMIIPVSLYFILNNNPTAESGWGIPMATDIAFALAVVKSVGKRAPLAMIVFLTAFAIIDDIGAVLVIALFYSEEIKVGLLLFSILPLATLALLGYLRFYSGTVWFILGATVWLLFLKAGIHPTIAGVLLAFTVPLTRRLSVKTYVDNLSLLVQKIKKTGDNDDTILNEKQIHYVNDLESWTDKLQSPLQQLEHRLHYWVAILILPVFALANAGVVFDVAVGIDWRLAMVISVSLFVGKFIGVPLFTIIGLRLRLTELPQGMNLHNVIGAGLIAGVGFTMAIFISNLAFTDPVLTNSAKIGILIGSFVAGILGYLFMRFTGKASKSLPGSAPLAGSDKGKAG